MENNKKKEDNKKRKNIEKLIETEKPSFNFISYKEKINPNSDLIPIHISYNKKMYYADISTLEYINKRMINYLITGENKNGLYFRDKDLIIVKSITRENIQEVLEDMVKYGDFKTLTQIHTI